MLGAAATTRSTCNISTFEHAFLSTADLFLLVQRVDRQQQLANGAGLTLHKKIQLQSLKLQKYDKPRPSDEDRLPVCFVLYNNANQIIIFQLQNYSSMSAFLLFLFCLSLSLQTSITRTAPCPCLNDGQCDTQSLTIQCRCPSSFIGEHCQLPANQISSQPIKTTLTTKYSYFYFTPDEVNYYKMIFNICMRKNPSQRYSLFYIETQKNDGSLRETPSLFETAKIVLGQGNCTTFSTHYISVKRREDDSFRKIVIGLKVMENDENDKYLNTYYNHDEKLIKSGAKKTDDKEMMVQEVELRMTYEVYLQSSYYGTFIILFTAFVLLIILASFITYLKKKYTMETLDIDSINLQAFDLHRLTRNLRRQRINPEESILRETYKNNLHSIEMFMPVTLYRQTQQTQADLGKQQQSSQAEQQGQTCSICLLQFQPLDEIRTTPCRHRYHRDCIDSWCETNFTCPICRHKLNFNKELRDLYIDFLRHQVTL